MTKRTEEFKVKGEDIVEKIKDLIKQGNIRRIIIKDKNGKSFAEFPLTFGVVGTVILPVAAAIGTIIALVADCTISVEKEEDDKEIVEGEEREGKDAK
jgi:hypothetical protein